MSCFYCLVKCLQSHSDFLSFLLSLAAKVDVLDLHGARVLQMKIYEVHRGREMGGARGERGVAKVEEEEVLRRGRKQSLTQSGTETLFFPLLCVTLQRRALSQFTAYMYCITLAVCDRSNL